jgi:hypothetical protein
MPKGFLLYIFIIAARYSKFYLLYMVHDSKSKNAICRKNPEKTKNIRREGE